mmetsp:Transcript_44261/g.137855  ORF Transcript_44261/g.137855 Transcript_44261/m.137855 type:complete len:205 (+) Transcript_44261:437-1051(+)
MVQELSPAAVDGHGGGRSPADGAFGARELRGPLEGRQPLVAAHPTIRPRFALREGPLPRQRPLPRADIVGDSVVSDWGHRGAAGGRHEVGGRAAPPLLRHLCPVARARRDGGRRRGHPPGAHPGAVEAALGQLGQDRESDIGVPAAQVSQVVGLCLRRCLSPRQSLRRPQAEHARPCLWGIVVLCPPPVCRVHRVRLHSAHPEV